MDDLAKQLRELEAEVDALMLESRPGQRIPMTAAPILRSVSALLLSARWIVEDANRVERLPEYATGDRE